MTKEEKIKEAWDNLLRNIKNYKLTKKQYDLNGWVNLDTLSLMVRSYLADNQSSELDLNVKNNTIRPKSLQGIEDNNGWTRIESEDDLPKENGMYHVYYSDGVISSRFYHAKHNDWLNEPKATHYQPIVKPKPPIY